MSSTCTPSLVGVASLVLEILLVLKFCQFSFSDHGLQVIIKTFKKEKCRVAAIKTNTNKAV